MSTIKEQILNSHVYERYTTENGSKRLGILEDELDEILKEAAQEFPKSPIHQGQPDFDQFYEWLHKWFGEPAAVDSQIAGGCQGHIDWSKVTVDNIEKEP